MGSNSGQDCERPIHRVWIDSFLLAATQVTNAEYERFLRATSAAPPPFWQDPNFNHPQQPVAGVSWHEAARYCEWLSSQTDPQLSPAHRSRMGARRPRRSRTKTISLGRRSATIPPRLRYPLANRPRARSPLRPQRPSAYTTSATTFTNGAATGTTRTTTPISPERNPRGPDEAR